MMSVESESLPKAIKAVYLDLVNETAWQPSKNGHRQRRDNVRYVSIHIKSKPREPKTGMEAVGCIYPI